MAKVGSSEGVGEHMMFAPEAASFALPPVDPALRDSALGTDRSQTGAGIGAAADRADTQHRSVLRSGQTGSLWWRRPLAALPSRNAIVRSIGHAASTEIDRGAAFILAPVLLALGALAYFSLAREPAFLSLGGGMAILLAAAFAARERHAFGMAAAAALLCVFGALLAKTETWRAGTRMLGGDVTSQISGTVTEIERLASGRVRLTIDVARTERPVLRYAPDRVRVSARRIPEEVTAGATVTGLVRLMPPSGPVRPGGYDFSFESYFDRIGASGFFLRGPEVVALPASTTPLAAFRAAVEQFRYGIAERIAGRIGGAEGEIAAALVVGVRAGIPEDVNEALRRAGIYHIISISGLHMALVAGTIMGLLRVGFALFRDFSSRRPVKKYAAALALVGLCGYLFISGAEVAAQRSFIMLAVMLTAVLFDRAALTLRNLAIAAIIVIAISPHEVVGPSFQMSFAATAALVGAYAAWSDWRAERPGRPTAAPSLPRRLLGMLLTGAAGLAVTSVVAGGATAIYAAWHFQQMPSLGLFTNLAAMPIVSVVVMPFAVLGSLAMPFGLDGPFFQVMGLGLSATVAIARWFAERSPTDMVGLVPASAVAVLTVALIVATVSSTWLRAAAIPIALFGFMLLFDRPRPDLFVSEDGRLLGLDIGAGHVVVNRSRPNEFTIENWKRAFRANVVVRPSGKEERDALNSKEGGGASETTLTEMPSAPGFVCAEGLCLARYPSGAVVAHALDAAAAIDLCSAAGVIVIEDASARDVCRWKDVLVITGRELALSGSAAVTFSASGATAVAEFAINQPYRPWHVQRQFSRAARGLPPYRPKNSTSSRAGATQAEPPEAGGNEPGSPAGVAAQ